MNKVAICTINYTSKTETINLLKILNDLEGNFEVYILENGSPKNKLIKQDLPKTKYKKHFYISSKNLGYAGGNNLLIKKALKLGNYEYFWLLNNDTLPSKNSLVELLKTFDIKNDAGVIGSLVVQENNKVWWAGSTVDLSKGKIIKKYYGENIKVVPTTISKSDEINGATMLIKKEVINKIGFLDTVFFHTAEDTDYSIRAKMADFGLYINPRSKVLHGVGKSSGGAYSASHMFYVERGRLLLMRKWKKLKIISYLYLIPLWAKRIAAPIIRKQDFKSSFYAVRGIIEGLFNKM